MFTTILAFLIAALGLIMTAGGLWGLYYLFDQRTSMWLDQRTSIRIPLRYYAMAIGMICGGFAMVAIAQALRLLLVLVTR
jgi:hypothetical protein